VSPEIFSLVNVNLAGAAPDGAGDIQVATFTFQNNGPGAAPAVIDFTTIPSFQPGDPLTMHL
jgi:hypothetical protein